MAKAEQIIELLKSHINGDDGRFYAIAMQVAASEAQKGHEKLASELKNLIDDAKINDAALKNKKSFLSLAQPKGELASLIAIEASDVKFSDLIFDKSITERFERIILEQKQQHKLLEYGLKPRRKILLHGLPGTGKTVTASALATELRLPLFSIRLDSLITKFMGETATKLRLIFDSMKTTRAVYFFDEFDAIGGDRGFNNDVGEIRRILNSFLQFMEHDKSDSLIIAATNHIKLLDSALFRRFDDVIEYTLPNKDMIEQLVKNRLYSLSFGKITWAKIVEKSYGLSHAEITRACDEAAKNTILTGGKIILEKVLLSCIEEKKTSSLSAAHERPQHGDKK